MFSHDACYSPGSHVSSLVSYTSGDLGITDNKNDPRYPSIVLISSPADPVQTPPGFGTHPDVSGISEGMNETQSKGDSEKILKNKGRKVQRVESNLASEEVLLSLSKAPLALMDDDDELGSTSATSSYSSFQLKSKPREDGSKTSLYSSDLDQKAIDKSNQSNSSSNDSIARRSSDPEYDSRSKSQRSDSHNFIPAQDPRPEAELVELVAETSEKPQEINPESDRDSSESSSSDEEDTHIYDTSSSRNIILPSVSDDESPPSIPAVERESLLEDEQELPPPPTYEDLDDVTMDEVRKLIAAGKASGVNKTSSSIDSGSDFEMLDSDRGGDKSDRRDNTNDNKEAMHESGTSHVEDDAGMATRSNEDVLKEVSDITDPEILPNENPVKFLPPTALPFEIKQQSDDIDSEVKESESKFSSLLVQAGSPTGLDLGSIPHIDDVSDSQDDSETECKLLANRHRAVPINVGCCFVAKLEFIIHAEHDHETCRNVN